MRDGTKCHSHCNKNVSYQKGNFSPSLFLSLSHSISFSLSPFRVLCAYVCVFMNKCVLLYSAIATQILPDANSICMLFSSFLLSDIYLYENRTLLIIHVNVSTLLEIRNLHFELCFTMNFYFI